MSQENISAVSNLAVVPDIEKSYQPYTPPTLIILKSSSIENLNGSGADAGGYPGHNNS